MNIVLALETRVVMDESRIMDELRMREVNAEGLKVINNMRDGMQQYYCELCDITLPFFLPSALQHCNGKEHCSLQELEINIAIAEGAITMVNQMYCCNICNMKIGFGLNEALNHCKQHKNGDRMMVASGQNQPHNTSHGTDMINNELRFYDPGWGDVPVDKVDEEDCFVGGEVEHDNHNIQNMQSEDTGLNRDVIPTDLAPKPIKVIRNKYFCEMCNIYLPMEADVLLQHSNGRIHEIGLLKAQGVITVIDRQCYCAICKISIGFRFRAAVNHYQKVHKSVYKKMLHSKHMEPDHNFQGPGSAEPKTNMTSILTLNNIAGTSLSVLSGRKDDAVSVEASQRCDATSQVDDHNVKNSPLTNIKTIAQLLPKGFKMTNNNYYCEVCKIQLPIDVDFLQHCFGRKHEIELLISQGGITMNENKCHCEICKKDIGFGFRPALKHFRNLHKEEYKKLQASKELRPVGKFHAAAGVDDEPASKKLKRDPTNGPNAPNFVRPKSPSMCTLNSLNFSNSCINDINTPNNMNISVAPNSSVSGTFENSTCSSNIDDFSIHRVTESTNLPQKIPIDHHYDPNESKDTCDRRKSDSKEKSDSNYDHDASRDSYNRHKTDVKEKSNGNDDHDASRDSYNRHKSDGKEKSNGNDDRNASRDSYNRHKSDGTEKSHGNYDRDASRDSYNSHKSDGKEKSDGDYDRNSSRDSYNRRKSDGKERRNGDYDRNASRDSYSRHKSDGKERRDRDYDRNASRDSYNRHKSDGKGGRDRDYDRNVSRDSSHKQKVGRNEKKDSCHTSTSTSSSQNRTSSSGTRNSDNNTYLLVDSLGGTTTSKTDMEVKVEVKQEEEDHWLISSSCSESKADTNDSSQINLQIKVEMKQEQG